MRIRMLDIDVNVESGISASDVVKSFFSSTSQDTGPAIEANELPENRADTNESNPAAVEASPGNLPSRADPPKRIATPSPRKKKPTKRIATAEKKARRSSAEVDEAILEFVSKAPAKAAAIVGSTGISASVVRRSLDRLCTSGQLKQSDDGVYRVKRKFRTNERFGTELGGQA